MYLLLYSLPGCKLQTSTDTTTERWARLAERGGEKVDSWSANSGDVVLRRRIYKSRTITFPVLSIKNNSIKCRVVVYLNWFSDKGGECEGGVWSVGTARWCGARRALGSRRSASRGSDTDLRKKTDSSPTSGRISTERGDDWEKKRPKEFKISSQF